MPRPSHIVYDDKGERAHLMTAKPSSDHQSAIHTHLHLLITHIDYLPAKVKLSH